MKIIWHGHSCFEILTEMGTVVLDPYMNDSVPGLPPLSLEADAVLCSHEHNDHNGRTAVRLSGRTCTVSVSAMDTWHDDMQGAARGTNKIYLLHAEGMTVAHLGDLGCALTSDQAQTLDRIDVLLIPIGGYYTINTEQAIRIVEVLHPRVTIPMHYRGVTMTGRHFGYDVISTSEQFRIQCQNAIDYESNVLEVGKDTTCQTAFLNLR